MAFEVKVGTCEEDFEKLLSNYPARFHRIPFGINPDVDKYICIQRKGNQNYQIMASYGRQNLDSGMDYNTILTVAGFLEPVVLLLAEEFEVTTGHKMRPAPKQLVESFSQLDLMFQQTANMPGRPI